MHGWRERLLKENVAGIFQIGAYFQPCNDALLNCELAEGLWSLLEFHKVLESTHKVGKLVMEASIASMASQESSSRAMESFSWEQISPCVWPRKEIGALIPVDRFMGVCKLASMSYGGSVSEPFMLCVCVWRWWRERERAKTCTAENYALILNS